MQQLWHNVGSFAPLLHCRLQIAEVGNVSCHKITVTLHNQPPLTDQPSDNKVLLYIHQCDSPCMAVVTWIIIPFPAIMAQIRLPAWGVWSSLCNTTWCNETGVDHMVIGITASYCGARFYQGWEEQDKPIHVWWAPTTSVAAVCISLCTINPRLCAPLIRTTSRK